MRTLLILSANFVRYPKGIATIWVRLRSKILWLSFFLMHEYMPWLFALLIPSSPGPARRGEKKKQERRPVGVQKRGGIYTLPPSLRFCGFSGRVIVFSSFPFPFETYHKSRQENSRHA